MLQALSQQIREVQLVGAGIILALASAITGLVWISIWIARLLNDWLGPKAAPLIVGLLLLAPLAIFIINRMAKHMARKQQQQQVVAAEPAMSLAGGHQDELANITRAAESFVEKSPLVALAIAALAGILAVRFPGALTLLAQIVGNRQQAAAAAAT